MENEAKQDSKSLCCGKFMKNKFLVAFLGLVVVVAIFAAGFCAGFRGNFHRGEGHFGRHGGMMQGQWGNGGRFRGMHGFPQGGDYGQPAPDQAAPAPVSSTAPTATQK